MSWIDLHTSIQDEFGGHGDLLDLHSGSLGVRYWIDARLQDPDLFDIEDPACIAKAREQLEERARRKVVDATRVLRQSQRARRERLLTYHRGRRRRKSVARLSLIHSRRCWFCHRKLKDGKYISKRFCNRDCAKQHRVCRNPFCRKRLRATSQIRLFCSTSCRNFTTRSAKRKVAGCEECHGALPPRQKKFCSEGCKKKADCKKARLRRSGSEELSVVVCRQCGRTLQGAHRAFCSTACSKRAKQASPSARVASCRFCHVQLPPQLGRGRLKETCDRCRGSQRPPLHATTQQG